MALIPLAEPTDGPEVAAALAELAATRAPTDLQRVLANSPSGLRSYLTMSNHVRADSGLEPALREVVILRVQQHLGGEFEWRRHYPAARAAGVSDAALAGLAGWSDVAEFSARQRAALALVDAHLGDGSMTDARSGLVAEFSAAEIVEVCLLVGFYLLGATVILPLDLGDGDTFADPPVALQP